ncbi:MAG: ATP-binding protein [Spirochaetia bacterium]|nr:ATP-binding protein [Spirochaetia bacterium]
MQTKTLNILLIEDDKNFAELIKYLLATVYHVHVFVNSVVSLKEASSALHEQIFDAILLDINLPDAKGLNSLSEIISLSRRSPVIILTSNEDIELSMEAMKLGAQDYLYKSKIDGGILIRSIQYAIERNRLNAALVESEQKYYSLFAGAIDMLIILDEDGNIKDANPAFCKKVKLNRESILSKNFNYFLPKREQRLFLNTWRTFIQEGEAKGVFIMFDANRILFPVEYTARSNFISGMHMIISRDISSRKIQDRKIKSYKKTVDRMGRDIKAFYDTTDSPILRISTNLTIKDCNTASSQIKNLKRENIIGTSIFDYFLSETQGQKTILNEFKIRILNSDKPESIETSIQNGTGEILTFIFNATCIRDPSGNIQGAWLTGQNITNLQKYKERLQKQVQRQTEVLQNYLDRERQLTSVLRESLNKEKELGELKSRFVSMASHEFRTPLTTILASSDILQKYKDQLNDQGIEERIRKIQSSVKDMTDMVDNILIIGRYESGGLKIEEEVINIETFCNDIVNEILNESDANIHAEYKIFSKSIISDKKYLRHILRNLLSNSVKFSRAGAEVRLIVTEEQNNLDFSVEDSGIGIAEEDLPYIFQPFHRGKNTGGISGSGLGLSIIKGFVELMNGEITLNSRLGEGSKFSVTIPNLAQVKTNEKYCSY